MESRLTGPANQGFIDAHEAKWKALEAQAETCRTGPQFSTIAKILSGTPDADGFYTMEWNLLTEVRRESQRQKIHLIVRIKVKPSAPGTSAIYDFKEPSARLQTGAPGNYSVGGIQIERNGEVATDFTTWLFLDRPNVTSTTLAPLHTAGDGFAVVTQTSMSDSFALKFTYIKDAAGVDM